MGRFDESGRFLGAMKSMGVFRPCLMLDEMCSGCCEVRREQITVSRESVEVERAALLSDRGEVFGEGGAEMCAGFDDLGFCESGVERVRCGEHIECGFDGGFAHRLTFYSGCSDKEVMVGAGDDVQRIARVNHADGTAKLDIRSAQQHYLTAHTSDIWEDIAGSQSPTIKHPFKFSPFAVDAEFAVLDIFDGRLKLQDCPFAAESLDEGGQQHTRIDFAFGRKEQPFGKAAFEFGFEFAQGLT